MASLNEYLKRSAEAIVAMVDDRELSAAMERAVEAIVAGLGAGKPLLVCGNGGSAADAIHIAGELVGRFLKERKAYNVLALPSNVGVMTAWGNDYGFDTVYSRQVEAHGVAGGVLIAISTSGNSTNVLLAAEQARAMGMTVVSLTGSTGGKLAALSDILLNVPSTFTPVIQQGHLCLYHHLCEAVEARLADG
ncbi:phosphoheptose isomerase [Mesorhizobium sp. L-8-10]|uniref:D-sedoheptulose-7-phosphate isomerase n=1 Tax=unclassified Mesorhizobium TaxID=325217 RepID=UPI00192852CF|nr:MULTISPECIES: SIS domain-containing protein [unclassified Mesorhizobium]BCH23780.1 phosphoheptose isomerase [Mesorhizobium sp. L-8-3]BCH31508.1 phosphoheptose isomerase [Mesorhizobium sp. L-8-10]